MNPVRKRKLGFLILLLLVLGAVAFLVLYALRQNINLFYTPIQIAQGEAPVGHRIRIGGMVVKNSIQRSPNSLDVRFQVTDFHATLPVLYHGILPDLFREGQGIVAMGELGSNQEFVAQEVLAKHDANYMPPELKGISAQVRQNEVDKNA